MTKTVESTSGPERGESGFTLVELLVVMLILGLLAAIAIPAFFDQRDKAKDASAKEIAASARTAMEAYSVDHDGLYTGADEAVLHTIEPTIPTDVPLAVTSVGAHTYKVTVTSRTGNTFSIARAESGVTSFECTDESVGGCPAGGHWN